jgi:hypothetical protein
MSEKIKLAWFLDYVIKYAPEQEHKVVAYMALTRLRALQSGRTDPKYHASLKLTLLAHVGMTIKVYGMIGRTPEELLEEEGV